MSYADLFQLASALAIEEAGGPFIPLRVGRKDAADGSDCTPDGRLPGDLLAPRLFNSWLFQPEATTISLATPGALLAL